MKRYTTKSEKPIKLKTSEEIEKIRIAGQLAGAVLDMIEPHVKPGLTTNELDRICHNYMVNIQKTVPAPLHYRGYPKSICTSVNYQVCHAIPTDKRLKNGDIINIDITVIKNGYHGDMSRMYFVGKPSVRARRLVKISYECLCKGIEAVKPGAHLGDIGYAIQNHAEKQRCSVVQEYCGHGIGRDFHEEPQVLHYGKTGDGIVLKPGMTFTIEPMINAGKHEVRRLQDGWTVVTKDHSLSAQWEHTLLVTDTGVEVLTPSCEVNFSTA
ncbi:MAG: type I methionyl aminopeptidase [Gammaproteobacteria bacterium]|nr:type I methionyl aminopeptidase [Gammaproteobacteria bacterium]